MANGEIDVLDPAGYRGVTITKAISIQGHGFSGITVASGANGITINAGPTDAVHLQGLLIDGGGVGNAGIQFNSGASLTVENCMMRNMADDGILYFSTATTAQTFAVSNSYFNDNANNGVVIVTESSGGITASIDRTGFFHNRNGLAVVSSSGTGSPVVAVTDSAAANNSAVGFLVESDAGQAANLSLTHSLAEGNGTGLETFGTTPATLWLAQSTVTGNTTGGFNISGGPINTFQDNYFTTNGPNTGSLTSVGKL